MNVRREHPEFFQLLYHVLSDDAVPTELRAQMNERGMFLASELHKLIVEGQAAGEIARGDPYQLVVALLAYLDGLTRISLYDPQRFKEHFPDASIIMRIFRSYPNGSEEQDESRGGDDV